MTRREVIELLAKFIWEHDLTDQDMINVVDCAVRELNRRDVLSQQERETMQPFLKVLLNRINQVGNESI